VKGNSFTSKMSWMRKISEIYQTVQNVKIITFSSLPEDNAWPSRQLFYTNSNNYYYRLQFFLTLAIWHATMDVNIWCPLSSIIFIISIKLRYTCLHLYCFPSILVCICFSRRMLLMCLL